MDCVNLETYLLIAFGLLILASNFFAWLMGKNITTEFAENPDSISKWKLLLGDVMLPSNILTKKGMLWRKLSILSFLLLVLWCILFVYLQKQDWVCEFKSIPKSHNANKQINSDNYFSGPKPPTEIIAGY